MYPIPSSKLIRDDYRSESKLTLAEAAHEAGVAVQTVSAWLCRGNIKRANAKGPYRVDASSLYRFLETGKPQGR